MSDIPNMNEELLVESSAKDREIEKLEAEVSRQKAMNVCLSGEIEKQNQVIANEALIHAREIERLEQRLRDDPVTPPYMFGAGSQLYDGMKNRSASVWLKAWCACTSSSNCRDKDSSDAWADHCLAEYKARWNDGRFS